MSLHSQCTFGAFGPALTCCAGNPVALDGMTKLHEASNGVETASLLDSHDAASNGQVIPALPTSPPTSVEVLLDLCTGHWKQQGQTYPQDYWNELLLIQPFWHST